MEENRFFKFAWRFNALIIMVAGILAIGVLCFAGYEIFREVTRERTTRNIVNVAEDQPVNEKWKLGGLEKIDGTPFTMVPLSSDQNYAQAYSSKSSHSIRNYLFIDTQNNKKHWLFQTNKYLVINIDFLSEKECNAENRTIRAILYTVIEKDTNGDKRLTNGDATTIALSMPDGRGYKSILTGIDNFIGHQVLNRESMLLIYQKGGIGYTANVTFADFALFNESELPKIENTP